jgi:hypothetical protein
MLAGSEEINITRQGPHLKRLIGSWQAKRTIKQTLHLTNI